jgi:hypothetical protein
VVLQQRNCALVSMTMGTRAVWKLELQTKGGNQTDIILFCETASKRVIVLYVCSICGRPAAPGDGCIASEGNT